MTKPPSPRPLSIKVIATIHIAYAVFGIPFLADPYTFHNRYFESASGWFSYADTLGWACISAIIAIGLWRLNERARQLAIALSSYCILDSLLFLAFPPFRSARLLRLMNNGSSESRAWLVFTITAIILISVYSITIYFLIKHKSAFVKPAND